MRRLMYAGAIALLAIVFTVPSDFASMEGFTLDARGQILAGIREQHEEIRGVPRRENTADAHAIAGVGAAGHDRPAGEVDHLVVVLPQPQDLVGRRR